MVLERKKRFVCRKCVAEHKESDKIKEKREVSTKSCSSFCDDDVLVAIVMCVSII